MALVLQLEIYLECFLYDQTFFFLLENQILGAMQIIEIIPYKEKGP